MSYLQQGDRYFRTKDTRFASAVVCCGFSLNESPPFHKIEDPTSGKVILTWCINEYSDDGKRSIIDLKKAYDDPFFLKKGYEDLKDFKYAVSALKNRELMIDMVNKANSVYNFKGKTGWWYVPNGGKEFAQQLKDADA